MTITGPGIPEGVVSDARVGLHDLAPTILELLGEETIGGTDSTSFAETLGDASGAQGAFNRGFAEYSGGRYRITQRVIWDGPWKLAWNGFDFDELYNLDDDPYEMRNLIDDHSYEEVVQSLMHYAWTRVRDTDDRALWNSHYPILRLAPYGPNIVDS